MKLIIDIYEDQYEFIKQGMSIKKVMEYPALMNAICEYIANGIPLDKIKSEVFAIPQIDSDGHNNNWYREPQAIIDDVLKIIDSYAADKTRSKEGKITG